LPSQKPAIDDPPGKSATATPGPKSTPGDPAPPADGTGDAATDANSAKYGSQRVAPPLLAYWQNPPRVWRYESNGLKLAFLQTHNGWKEIARDAMFSYARATQHQDYIELERDNPSVKIRLRGDRAEISARGAPFKFMQRGGWSADPYPFAGAVRLAGRGTVSFPIEGLFGAGTVFQFECWFRPVSDLPPGDHILVESGPTSIVWTLQPDGHHRFAVRTVNKKLLYINHDWMATDWTRLLLACDGRRIFFAINANAMHLLDDGFLSDEVSGPPLTIGDSAHAVNSSWLDLAFVRVLERCMIDAPAASGKPSGEFRAPLEVPDAWLANRETRLFMAIDGRGDSARAVDRSSKRLSVQLNQAAVIDVLTAPPYVTVPDPSDVAVRTETSPMPAGDPDGSDAVGPSGNDRSQEPEKSSPTALDTDTTVAQRLVVPDSETRVASLEKVRAIYKSEFDAAKRAPEKLALANKLGETGRSMKDDPAAQFVLLDQARLLSADAGQTSSAFGWIGELEKRFGADGVVMKLQTAQRVNDVLVSSNNAPVALRSELIEHAIEASAAALDMERIEEADKLAQLALQHSRARQVSDADLKRHAKDHADSVTRFFNQWREAKSAEQRLAEDPDDATAHLAIGKFRCFRCNQWQLGLPHLARSGKAALAAAAELELASDGSSADLVKIGQAWEKAAEAASGAEKRDYQERAHGWYLQSMEDGRAGLDKEIARRRLDALQSVIPPAHPKQRITLPDGSTVDVHPGLIGRVYASGRDLGVVLIYEPGQPISTAKMQQLVSDLKLKGAVTFQFNGFLVASANELQLRHRGGGRATQQLLLNGQTYSQIDARRSSDSRLLTLDIGRHALSWQLHGIDLDRSISLEFVRRTGNKPLEVYYTKQMLETARANRSKAGAKGEPLKEYHVSE
jgi:hypothetical protein